VVLLSHHNRMVAVRRAWSLWWEWLYRQSRGEVVLQQRCMDDLHEHVVGLIKEKNEVRREKSQVRGGGTSVAKPSLTMQSYYQHQYRFYYNH